MRLPRNVLFDVEDTFSELCRICYLPDKTISACKCEMRYHQLCLLRYIKLKMLNMGEEVNLSQIRCKRCKEQFKVKYTEQKRYSCSHYCEKLERNWCEKTFVSIIVLIVLMTTLGIGIFFVAINRGNEIINILFYAFVAAECLVLVLLLIVLCYFVRIELKLTEITLIKVYEWHERRNSSSSLSSEDGHFYS